MARRGRIKSIFEFRQLRFRKTPYSYRRRRLYYRRGFKSNSDWNCEERPPKVTMNRFFDAGDWQRARMRVWFIVWGRPSSHDELTTFIRKRGEGQEECAKKRWWW